MIQYTVYNLDKIVELLLYNVCSDESDTWYTSIRSELGTDPNSRTTNRLNGLLPGL